MRSPGDSRIRVSTWCPGYLQALSHPLSPFILNMAPQQYSAILKSLFSGTHKQYTHSSSFSNKNEQSSVSYYENHTFPCIIDKNTRHLKKHKTSNNQPHEHLDLSSQHSPLGATRIIVSATMVISIFQRGSLTSYSQNKIRLCVSCTYMLEIIGHPKKI